MTCSFGNPCSARVAPIADPWEEQKRTIIGRKYTTFDRLWCGRRHFRLNRVLRCRIGAPPGISSPRLAVAMPETFLQLFEL
jgi:hypothetical protein